MKIDEHISLCRDCAEDIRDLAKRKNNARLKESADEWDEMADMFEELQWYKSQDLIRREDIMPVVKRHHYLLSDRINSTDYGMFTGGIEQIILEQIPKAEPPKEEE